ncbi:hypothetical protein Droror1_Dr00015243 [Drosera rotundifolia]
MLTSKKQLLSSNERHFKIQSRKTRGRTTKNFKQTAIEATRCSLLQQLRRTKHFGFTKNLAASRLMNSTSSSLKSPKHPVENVASTTIELSNQAHIHNGIELHDTSHTRDVHPHSQTSNPSPK